VLATLRRAERAVTIVSPYFILANELAESGTAADHVYSGDLVATNRSRWSGLPRTSRRDSERRWTT
jgi:hypothetical protein